MIAWDLVVLGAATGFLFCYWSGKHHSLSDAVSCLRGRINHGDDRLEGVYQRLRTLESRCKEYDYLLIRAREDSAASIKEIESIREDV